ncbi:MAG: HTH-type transcriptional regulator [Aeromicrobium sp.]|nr:HTH-type transcriptional regulator [Aeromicrobium sp.]
METPDDIEAARDALRQSFHPRAEQTRAAIVEAVRTLSDAGEHVTVSAIGRAAGVSRATFYTHYAGLDGLARTLRLDAFRAVDDLYRFDVHTTPDALRLRQVRLVEHFADHRSLYAAVASVPMSKASHDAGVRAWADIIRESLDDHPRRPPGIRPDAIARYVAAGASGLLEDWVSGKIALTESELVDHLYDLTPTWLHGAH